MHSNASVRYEVIDTLIHTPHFVKLVLIEEMVGIDVTPLRWHKVHPLLHRVVLAHLHGLRSPFIS